MKRLSHQTLIAIALAATWPVAPALAMASQSALAAHDLLPDDEAPLRLTMSYSLSLSDAPTPLPDPQQPQNMPRAAYLRDDPRYSQVRRMRLELTLHFPLDRAPPGDTPRVLAAVSPTEEMQGAEGLAATQLFPEAVVRAGNLNFAGTGKEDAIVPAPMRLPLLPVRSIYVLPAEPLPARKPSVPQQVLPLERDTRSDKQHAARMSVVRPYNGPVLRGRAWRLADQAYKFYARGEYGKALQRVEQALKLRSDVARLHLLRVYSLQKLDRQAEAMRAAEAAIDAGYTSAELRAALESMRPPVVSGETGVVTTANYRKGAPIATQAYEKYNDANYVEAATLAEKAVRVDPTQGPWVLLWLNALSNQDRFEDVLQGGVVAIALGAPNRDEIVARMRMAGQSIAGQHAAKAYTAIAANRPQDGIQEAREAVRRAPDVESYQLLLIGILQATQDLAGAEKAATVAIDLDSDYLTIQVLRAYLRQQMDMTDGAQQDIDAVLANESIDDVQRRNVRLIGADLALAAGRPERAVALLASFAMDDAQAQSRRKQARGGIGWWSQAAALDVAAYAPMQLCRDTPYGPVCEMQPWDAQGDDNFAARAYAAYAQRRYADAITLARKAVAQQSGNESNQNLLTTTLASGTRDERHEALARLETSLQARPGDATLLRQRAYLRLADGQPELALEDFVAARSTGNAPATNVLDEAYAMAATGNRLAAAGMLHQVIDDADAGKLTLDKQQRFDTRSSIANFSREWGVNASVGYVGARAASKGLFGQPETVPGNSVFSSVEGYWRPSNFLNSTTSTFDVYGRLSNTLYSGTVVTGAQTVQNPCGGTIDVAEARAKGGAGLPSTTGAVGARYTPSSKANLTFGVERQFLLGKTSRSGSVSPESADLRCQLNNQASTMNYKANAGTGGWQAYMLYGFYEGTALRLDASNWFTMEGYLQAGYTLLDIPVRYAMRDSSGNVLDSGDGKLRRGQAFAVAEVRAGRSFLTDYSDRLVIFPHVLLAADHYSNRNFINSVPLVGNGNSWSASAGVGVNFRYWLKGDSYNAQRSHVDWSMQYRTRLGGEADRAKGLFANMTFSY